MVVVRPSCLEVRGVLWRMERAQANIASEVIRNAKYYNSTHRKTQIRRTTQVYKDQDKNKDGAKKDLLLILSTKITTSI